jgi:DNA-binding PadR family transcriptional regulator
VVKGYLKIAVLKELNVKDASGYELIKDIAAFSSSKPSPGSIYPLLNDLLEQDYVKVREEGRKKIYSITAKGKRAITSIMKEKEEMLSKHLDMIHKVEQITGKKQISCIDAIAEKEVLLRNIDVFSELRETVISLLARSDYQEKEKEMRKILTDAIRRIKQLEKK